ncbi:hypothetical protein H7U27_09535 [Lactobacillus ingluviei]|nr:hypothetical protein [Limosilactobacillus ingluviei]MBM6729486.1 hypothetical protein [Limosilactobacillus ingluviei]
MSTTTETDIVNILWKALKNVAIENNNSADDQMHKFNSSNGIYYCSDHVEYTVIAREKYRPSLASFAWPEDIPFTEQNKYKYSLSQISLGLFFKFLKDVTLDHNFVIQNIFINSFYMGIFNNSGKAIDLFNKEVNLRQLLVCNIPNFARLFVMTSASICACNPTKLRA